MENIKVNKLEAAHRQLGVAIRLHFIDDDPCSVLTLAGAAAGVFADLVEKKAPQEWWDKRAWEANGITRKAYFDAMRLGQNFLKHADKDPDDTLEWTAADTESLIFFAILSAGEVGGNSPSEQVFQLWYFATRSHQFSSDFEPAALALEYFPGILEMTDLKRREFGTARLTQELQSPSMNKRQYPIAHFSPNPLIDPWVAQMQALDLRNRRRVLIRRPGVGPRPLYLYKYFSSDRPHSHDNLRDVIVESVLRLSSPSSFNDPFEFAAHFTMTATDDEKRARFEALARQQAPHLGWRAVQARIESLMSEKEEYLLPGWQKSLSQIRDEAGVYCFAGNAKKLLMWSHYASDHKGLCLQFERARDIAVLSHAISAEYKAELPTLNWVVNFQQDIGAMLFRKHPFWEYENESRLMIYGKCGQYLRFEPEALQCVIIGCRAELGLVDALDGWLVERANAGHPPLRVYKAHRHPRKYRLVLTRRSDGKPDPSSRDAK